MPSTSQDSDPNPKRPKRDFQLEPLLSIEAAYALLEKAERLVGTLHFRSGAPTYNQMIVELRDACESYRRSLPAEPVAR